MQKRRHTPYRLVRAILASSVFISAYAHANTYGPGSTVGPVATSTTFNNIIEVLNNGQIVNGVDGFGVDTDAVTLNTISGKVIVDANNFYVGKDAILASTTPGGAPTVGVDITSLGQKGTVTVNAGSGIHSTGTFVDPLLTPSASDAIFVNSLDTVITNQGTIASDNFSAIHVNVKVTNTLVNNLLGGVITNSPTSMAATILTDANPAFFKGGSTLALQNQGVVQSLSPTQNSIQLDAYFTQIQNQFGGQILLQEGNAQSNIQITPPFDAMTGFSIGGAGGGNIINQVGGLMAVNNVTPSFTTPVPANILISATSVHDIINNGDIVTENGYDAISIQAYESADFSKSLNASVNRIINTGLIASLGAESGDAIYLYTNSGNTPLTVTVNEIRNSGTIYSEGSIAIEGNSAGGIGTVTITNGIFNTGDIIAGNGVGFAGWLAISGPSLASIFQQRGLIIGDIDISDDKSPGPPPTNSVLDLSGGAISGSFFSPTGRLTHINITGGSLTDTIWLQSFVNGVDMSGGDVSKFLVYRDNSINTFNFSGGHVNQLNGGFYFNTNNTLYVQGIYHTGVIEYIQNIHVISPYTILSVDAPLFFDRQNTLIDNVFDLHPFTITRLHAPIDVQDGDSANITVHIEPNARLDVIGNQVMNLSNTNPITTLRNQGRLGIDSESSLLLTVANPDGFIMTDDALWEVGINGLMNNVQHYGKIVVQSAYTPLTGPTQIVNFEEDSTIYAYFKGFLPDNTPMTILTLNSPTDAAITTTDLSDLEQQPSAVIFFTKHLSAYNQDIILVSHRRHYHDLSMSGATLGLADTLDVLAEGAGPTNPNLFFLLSELDQLPTRQDLELAMQSLAPPFNNAIQNGSHLAMEAIFDNITERIWDFAWPYRFQQTSRPPEYPWDIFGFNGGDFTQNMNMWFSPIGLYADQGHRNNVHGYRAKGLGGAIGVDWAWDRCTLLGLAASYFKLHVTDHNVYPKNEAIKSWQGSLYGSFEFCDGIYMDAIFGAANNQYHLNRVIGVNTINTAAQSHFSGLQWGGQVDVGIIWPTDNRYMVAPFIELEYLRLNLNDYKERGAGDLSLTVSTPAMSNFIGGLGVRVATNVPYYSCELVPEISVMFGYAFHQSAAVSQAGFFGGGPTFVTPNALPRRTLIDLGIGFNILTATQTVLTLQYNAEIRNHYFANTGNIQYTFNWG